MWGFQSRSFIRVLKYLEHFDRSSCVRDFLAGRDEVGFSTRVEC